MERAIVSTMEDMPRIQITTDNSMKEEKEFGWSKDPYKTTVSVEDKLRVSSIVIGIKDQIVDGLCYFRAQLENGMLVRRMTLKDVIVTVDVNVRLNV